MSKLAARIDALKAESATVEEWDGDTQDDIHETISGFARLLVLAGARPD